MKGEYALIHNYEQCMCTCNVCCVIGGNWLVVFQVHEQTAVYAAQPPWNIQVTVSRGHPGASGSPDQCLRGAGKQGSPYLPHSQVMRRQC